MASDIAICMYYTGLDLHTGEEVFIARNLRDRKLHRALFQFFKPENDFEVREALMQAGRHDLIGSGRDVLIPAQPPRAAFRARMERSNRALAEGKFVHTIPAQDATADEPPGPRRLRPRARRRPR